MCRKGNSHALLVGIQTGVATMETVLRFLKKLKLELPYNPAIPHRGIYPKKIKTLAGKLIYTVMFIAAEPRYRKI